MFLTDKRLKVVQYEDLRRNNWRRIRLMTIQLFKMSELNLNTGTISGQLKGFPVVPGPSGPDEAAVKWTVQSTPYDPCLFGPNFGASVHERVPSTLMSPCNMYYSNEHFFYFNGQLKAIWKYVDFIVSTKIFHFQQLPKMAPMYRQTQKSLFFSKCNFEPLIIENIIFPIIKSGYFIQNFVKIWF